MAKRSTEWLRGYVYGLEAHSLTGRAAHLKQVRAELAEAEAREAGEPTAAECEGGFVMEIDVTNAHPCPDCRQCLTNADKCRYCAERDQLRAENERLRVDLAGTEARQDDAIKSAEAVERERDELQALIDMQHGRVVMATRLWREAHPGNDLVMPDLGRLIDWLILRSDEALAHVEDLRAALEDIASDGVERSRDPRTLAAEAALARTPAQSLAKVKAGALREATKNMVDMARGVERTRTNPVTWEACEEWLQREADRLEKEATAG